MYGIRGKAVKCFKSYLNNRTRRVITHRDRLCSKSEIVRNTVGVPQESTLGPILPIIFINKWNFEATDITTYAYDTNLLIERKEVCEIILQSTEMFLKCKMNAISYF